jgi:hypothetical protein
LLSLTADMQAPARATEPNAGDILPRAIQGSPCPLVLRVRPPQPHPSCCDLAWQEDVSSQLPIERTIERICSPCTKARRSSWPPSFPEISATRMWLRRGPEVVSGRLLPINAPGPVAPPARNSPDTALYRPRESKRPNRLVGGEVRLPTIDGATQKWCLAPGAHRKIFDASGERNGLNCYRY